MRYFAVPEDTRLLLILVIIISCAILVMGTLMVTLHCRRVREKHWQDKVTDNFNEQEIWPQQPGNNKVYEYYIYICSVAISILVCGCSINLVVLTLKLYQAPLPL